MNAPLPLCATVTVRAATSSDLARWDAFVATCPQATFFHRFAWREIYESVFNHRTHYLIAERAGEVAGILPIVEMRSLLFGHSLSSLPFAQPMTTSGPGLPSCKASLASGRPVRWRC